MAYTTIDDPTIYFIINKYTGSSGSQTFNLGFQPDLIWTKNLNTGYNHVVVDSVRGNTKVLEPNTTDAEGTATDAITSFNSNGYTVGANTSSGGFEDDFNGTYNSPSYVAFCWKESPTAGFDILTFTGNASGNQTISHNLSAVPKWWNIKRLGQASNWCTYHVGLGGADHNVFLNANSSNQTDTAIWNNTLPTSSVFSVGNNIDANGNGASHIWYGWAEKQGFSKFGSYTGNGNSDGPFVYTGHRPAWVMIKGYTNTGSWRINDNKREPFNVMDTLLFADTNDGDTTNSGYSIDFLSNGFKIRGTNASANASGVAYIFMAFAESPFINSKSVPTNAR